MAVVSQSEARSHGQLSLHTLTLSLCRLLQHLLSSLSLQERSPMYRVTEEVSEGAVRTGVQPYNSGTVATSRDIRLMSIFI